MELKFCFFKFLGILYALFLVYCCFLLPFTLDFDVTKPFNNTKEFTIAYTVSGVILTGTAIVTNILICCIIIHGGKLNGALNFLLILMSVADIFQPLLHYPLEVTIHWILLRHGPAVSLSNFKLVMQYTHCLRSGFARLSILSLVAVSIFRFYCKINKKKKMIAFPVKVIAVFLIISCAAGLTTFQFLYYHEEWQHMYDAVCTIYVPLAVTVLFAYCAYCCTDRSSHDILLRGRRLVFYGLILSYVVCWFPWYTIQLFQDFCCLMPYYGEYDHDRTNHITSNFVQLKCCTNIFIILAFDREFQAQIHDLRTVAQSCCCCSTRKTNMRKELNSISLSYYKDMDTLTISKNNGDYVMNWLKETRKEQIDVNENLRLHETNGSNQVEISVKEDDQIPLVIDRKD